MYKYLYLWLGHIIHDIGNILRQLEKDSLNVSDFCQSNQTIHLSGRQCAQVPPLTPHLSF